MEPEEEAEEEPIGAEEEEAAEPSTGVTLKHSRDGSPSPGLRNKYNTLEIHWTRVRGSTKMG